jgi:hypothetical protein
MRSMQIAAILRDMLAQHPLLIVFDILALMTAAGCFVVLVREAVLFRGYRSLKRITKSLRATLRGSVFRDGTDLVISGFYRGIPTVVRFSFAENTPEMNLWMKIASGLNLFISHKSSKATDGRVRIPTRDAWFDERFTIRTDNPNDALALLSDSRAFSELKKLCCSPGTSLALGRESLELSELTIPQPNTLKHLTGHMDSLAETAVRVGAISNLDPSRNKIYVPDRYLLARAALVVLAIAGSLEVYSAVHRYALNSEAPSYGDSAIKMSTVPEEDQLLIPGFDAWRLAGPEDFDPATVTWMREHGNEINGRIIGYFGGPDKPAGRSYFFVPNDPARHGDFRFVLLTDGHPAIDGAYPQILAAILVPKSKLTSIAWQAPDNIPAAPDGDGIMMIRRSGDTDSATIFFLNGGRLQTKIPADYLSLAIH